MKIWQDTFNELKTQYLTRSIQRLDQIEERLSGLSKKPDDITMLRDLMRQFHWLAGSGGIYGFSQISKLGTHGEQICEQILQEAKPINRSDWDKFKALLDALRAAFNEGEDPQRATIQKQITKDAPALANVVVIDSDDTNTLRITRLLEEHQISVKLVNSTSAALHYIGSELPKAFILCLPLSDNSGYEFVEKIREMPHGEEPVIFMIAKETGFLDKVQAIHCGSDGFYETPVDWEAMIQRLSLLLDRNKPSLYRILSVEDDPDQAAYIKAVLDTVGYKTSSCINPKEFEEYLISVKPDLVLLDIVLPEISGYELARYLRQDERYATLPILFLTTQNQLAAHIESARSGVDDHLVKPVDPALLLSAVSSRLERARFLKALLHRDGLTRFLTHAAFMESAQATVAQCKRNPERLASMIILDIDNIQTINDTYGYAAGDRVLSNLSTLIKQRLRQSDKVGRYGGDELAIVVEDLEEFDAVCLASRLLEDFCTIKHNTYGNSSFVASFSAGVTSFDPKVMDLERWRRMAEQSLKTAKAQGKRCVMKAQLGRTLG
jgi:diguanylate cyclase (GGDEF)-like protein